jgi:hypothetical protein
MMHRGLGVGREGLGEHGGSGHLGAAQGRLDLGRSPFQVALAAAPFQGGGRCGGTDSSGQPSPERNKSSGGTTAGARNRRFGRPCPDIPTRVIGRQWWKALAGAHGVETDFPASPPLRLPCRTRRVRGHEGGALEPRETDPSSGFSSRVLTYWRRHLGYAPHGPNSGKSPGRTLDPVYPSGPEVSPPTGNRAARASS